MNYARMFIVGFTKECGGDFIPSEDIQHIMYIRYVSYTIISPIIVLLGVICNCINLLTLTFPTVLKGVTKIYIRTLTIADLCALLALLPVVHRLNKIHQPTYTAAIYYAYLETYLAEVFVRFSSFLVVCLSFDRYLAVCHPSRFKKFHSKRTAMKCVIVSFLVAAIITTPLIFIKIPCNLPKKFGENAWDTKENVNITRHVWWSVYVWLYEIFTVYGTFISVAVFNVSISFRYQLYMKKKAELLKEQLVNKVDVKKEKSNMNLYRRKQREESRVVFMLQMIVILFFLTMTPTAGISIVCKTTARPLRSQFRRYLMIAIGNNLLMVHLAMNFFIYSFCNKEFRNKVKILFCKCL